MEIAYLGLGTNIGDKLSNLDIAKRKINAQIGQILKSSSIYTTDAWGIEDQDTFLNQVIAVETAFSAADLLERVLSIEKEMGRERKQKWGARLIDVDILFLGDLIIETHELIVPHPFIAERNFVLVPMVELAADFLHPISKFSMQDLLNQSKDPLKVEVFLGEE